MEWKKKKIKEWGKNKMKYKIISKVRWNKKDCDRKIICEYVIKTGKT